MHPNYKLKLMQTYNANKLKELVKSKYSEIATRSDDDQNLSCCGPVGCCNPSDEFKTGSDSYINLMAESYDRLDGYQPDADLHLGCGILVEFAGLKPGQSVLDLGSGAGNNLFVARSIAGDAGRLTGLDFSEEMIQKAAEAYVGCVSGATQKIDYLEIVENAGFCDVTVQKEREVLIPNNWISQVVSVNDADEIAAAMLKVLSISLAGKKT